MNRYVVIVGLDNTYVYDTVKKEYKSMIKGNGLEAREKAQKLADRFNKEKQEIEEIIEQRGEDEPAELEEDEPEGPGRYEILGQRIGQLVDRKQKEYGDSWGKAGEILKILYPNGVKPEEYHSMLGIVRVIDKLSRIANGNQGDENAWGDLAGYGLLGYFDKYR